MKSEGNRITSGKTLKILGFTFGSQPSPEAHVSKVESKFRAKIWSLRFLKRAKIKNEDIKDIYCSVLRPSIDYCTPTYHPMLSQDQSERLERLQMRALKTIYGWDIPYSRLLEMSGVSSLADRRIKLVDDFAQKTAKNPRFSTWFPRSVQTGHDTRQTHIYHEEFSRTERYKNSPVFYMRRRLNGMNGSN